jgi:hypothetical protein
MWLDAHTVLIFILSVLWMYPCVRRSLGGCVAAVVFLVVRSGWRNVRGEDGSRPEGKEEAVTAGTRGEERVFSGSGCLAGVTCGLQTLFTKMQQEHCKIISVVQRFMYQHHLCYFYLYGGQGHCESMYLRR